MVITQETTVKNILDSYPEAVGIFAKHGVDVPLECDESILDTELAICDSMCHIDDLDELMRDLQDLVNAETH
ncbi:MAG: hypothetical protein K2W95_27595 [Candidatus Obscuribacterales bacterium]|nr:hypothetical protein [Candidatus Obscuribacterales bacterium]